MTENKHDKTENEEARTGGEDPRLAGHALQDHDRVRAELDRAHADANEHQGTPVRSNPDLVPGPKDDALDEVRRVRAENEARTRAHSTVAIEERVAASTTSGSEKFIEVSTAGGRCFVNTHGEAVLDQDGVADFQRKLASAFQAVS